MFVFVVLIVHVALEYIFMWEITIFYNLQLCYILQSARRWVQNRKGENDGAVDGVVTWFRRLPPNR